MTDTDLKSEAGSGDVTYSTHEIDLIKGTKKRTADRKAEESTNWADVAIMVILSVWLAYLIIGVILI